MKRLLTIGFASILALIGLTACTEKVELPEMRGIEYGQYEGATNAAGEPHGYGVWILDNFRYDGYFVNGVPNGQGTLYFSEQPPAEPQASQIYVDVITVTGEWVDGLGEGQVAVNWRLVTGQELTWLVDVEKGCPVETAVLYSEESQTSLQFVEGAMVAGVPPWAPIYTNPNWPAPTVVPT